MKRARDEHPERERGKRTRPGIDPRSRPAGPGDDRADERADSREPADRSSEVGLADRDPGRGQPGQELHRDEKALHGRSATTCAEAGVPGQIRSDNNAA